MTAPTEPLDGQGFGKLLLFGEHAALYGHPAVGVALPLSVRLSYQAGIGNGIRLSNLPSRYRPAASALCKRLMELTDIRLTGTLRFDCDLPIGCGLGSSAALCVALADVASRLTRTGTAIGSSAPPVRREALWTMAHRLEQQFHGTPSGIDTGLSALGGLVAFRPAGEELPSAHHLRGLRRDALWLLIGALPRTMETRRLVEGIRARLDTGDMRLRNHIERLGALSGDAAEILEGGGAEIGARLGRLATEAQGRLHDMGLSTPELERCLVIAHTHGSIGGKLSGGGGGGAFYCLFADPTPLRAAARMIDQRHRTLFLAMARLDRLGLELLQ